jgi:glutathione S-transferase
MRSTWFKLYHCPATRSVRVKWLLCELLGDRFEEELVSLNNRAQHRPDYLRKNPNHCVPTLQITMPPDGSMYMIESGAMVTLLADAFPEKGLAPPAGELSFKRADYLQMLHFGASHMDMMLWQIHVHELLLPQTERDPRTSKRYRRKFMTEVEPQLKGRLDAAPYVCGEHFSAVDCIIGHNVIWARAYGLCQDNTFGSYEAVISSRPAFARAYADAIDFPAEIPAGNGKRASMGTPAS